MKKRKHEQDFGFKYHGVILQRGRQRYQVIHQTDEISYAVPIIKEGIVGGGVEKFPR